MECLSQCSVPGPEISPSSGPTRKMATSCSPPGWQIRSVSHNFTDFSLQTNTPSYKQLVFRRQSFDMSHLSLTRTWRFAGKTCVNNPHRRAMQTQLFTARTSRPVPPVSSLSGWGVLQSSVPDRNLFSSVGVLIMGGGEKSRRAGSSCPSNRETQQEAAVLVSSTRRADSKKCRNVPQDNLPAGVYDGWLVPRGCCSFIQLSLSSQ